MHYLCSRKYLYKHLTFSQTIYCRLFQTERVCRWQFQFQWKWQKVLQTGRKHCGKRRNCLLRAISPFLTVFSKDLYCKHVKTRACWERVDSFPSNKIPDLSKSNTCAGAHSYWKLFGKDENAGNQHFLFSLVFWSFPKQAHVFICLQYRSFVKTGIRRNCL